MSCSYGFRVPDSIFQKEFAPEAETSVEEENANHQKISHSNGSASERVKSQHPNKNNGKKILNGKSKKGSRFTVIGGQKVDLNSDKPQYLKLTLEQIQQLAMQQRSGI